MVQQGTMSRLPNAREGAFSSGSMANQCSQGFWLLAPTGALVVMMVYYIYIYLSAAPAFSDFHSVPLMQLMLQVSLKVA